MATNLETNIDFRITWRYKNTADTDGPVVRDFNSLAISDKLLNGTGLDQNDIVWHDVRTLSASSSEDLDMAGTLTDAFGNTVTFSKIKGIVLNNQTTTAGCILEAGGGSNDFNAWLGATGDKIKVGPNGLVVSWNPSLAGYSVTADTADILKITNTDSSNSITYQIVIVGTTA